METSDNRSEVCTLLEWDSRFWGFPVGRVNSSRLSVESLARVLDWCERFSIECLYFSADGSDKQTLSLAAEGGFHFVDMRIELEKRSGNVLIPQHEFLSIRIATEADSQTLKYLASQSFEDTRFFKDRNFDPLRSRVLYEKWIEKDLLENDILIYTPSEDENDIFGFISCSVNALKKGRIGLLAVQPSLRGKGVARNLLTASDLFFGKREVTSIAVATQASNVAAIRLYEGAGFMTRETRVWFHRWTRI